jgi:hypothetical protein
MAKNSRPILSVLIDEEKRTKFADLARRHSLSMGWLVNQAIDRMLESDSIDIYRDSIERIPAGTPMGAPIEQLLPHSIDAAGIEKLISESIEERLGNISNSSIEAEDIEKIVKSSINEYLQSKSIDSLVKAEIEPLADLLTELETYTQNQFKAVREELKKPLAISR